MMALGAIAARSGSPLIAAQLLIVVWIGHFVTDHAVYFSGMKLKPRFERSRRFSSPIARVASRLEKSPGALLGLIPARVLPLGRGAWLAATGVIGVEWKRFVVVDMAALVLHVSIWCGLGWWMGRELSGLVLSAEMAKVVALWTIAAGISAALAVIAWRRREQLVYISHRHLFSRERGDAS